MRRTLFVCALLLPCVMVAAYIGYLHSPWHLQNGGQFQDPQVESSLPVASPATQPTAPQIPGNANPWKLTWHDEFDAPKMQDLWTPHQYWDQGATNGEGDEKSDPANVWVADGMLKLQAKVDNKFGTPYTGALVQAGGIRDKKGPTFSFLFGYAEASIKIPAGQGLWPAFWLMPASYRDANGEIDIMDNGTGNPNTLHCGAIMHAKDYQHQHPAELSPGFHTFAVDWRQGRITWYVDGKEWAKTSDGRVIPTEALYPIFDLAVGGKWGGPPNAATQFPAVMEVDWIRVWQR